MEKFDNRPYDSIGSSRIRVRWLLPYWEEAEEYVIGKKYDVLMFQKVYWPAMMKAFEGVKILDLCDPDWLEGRSVLEFVDLADVTTTSTEALAEYIRKLRPNAFVQCVPDRVYLPEYEVVKTKHEGPLKKIGWFGYAHNAHYLYSTFDELIKRGIELVTISEQPIEPSLMYKGKIKLTNVPFNYDTLNRELGKCDAVLLPDPSAMDERGKYKSNNKTIQTWAIGMPVIKVPEDLDRFNDPKEREAEGIRARKEVEEKWDVKLSVDEYREIIRKVKEKKGIK